MKPSYKRPYYYIHNVNTSESRPTNPITYDTNGNMIGGTDYNEMYTIPGETPEVEVTTYEVIYGMLPNLLTIKEFTTPNAEGKYPGKLEITKKIEDSGISYAFVKIPDTISVNNVSMFTDNSGLRSNLNVLNLTTGYEEGKYYETPGYITYIGSLDGYSLGRGIDLKIVIE
jgi:hypothetical protein